MFVKEGDKEQENESDGMTQNAQRRSREKNVGCLIVGLNE